MGKIDNAEFTGESPVGLGLGNLVGQQLGRYLIRQRLGGGGVATVYQAYDQVLGRTIALKVLPPNSDQNTQNRFRREALMAGSLHHPHIVRILQVGNGFSGGIAYIAMDLVEGESLSALLARHGHLRPAESCNLLEPLARALAFAHRSGVVHRDVKPSNILLRPVSPGSPNSVQLESLDHPVIPLLSDFGIARFLDAPELTSTGRTVGTPAFMAPEQCAGSREVDGRTDIYALGTVLYRCIVGRLPYVGTTTQILHAHVYEPLTIEDRVLRQLPPQVIEILQHSLAKSPGERYSDAEQMASDLATAAGRTWDATPAERAGANVMTTTATLTLPSLATVAAVGDPDTVTILIPAPGAKANQMAANASHAIGPVRHSALSNLNADDGAVQSSRVPGVGGFKRYRWGGVALAAVTLLLAVLFGLQLAGQNGNAKDVAVLNNEAPTQPGPPVTQRAILAPTIATRRAVATKTGVRANGARAAEVESNSATTGDVAQKSPAPRMEQGLISGSVEPTVRATRSAVSTATPAPPPTPLPSPRPTEPPAPTAEPTEAPSVPTAAASDTTPEIAQAGVMACSNVPDEFFSHLVLELDEQDRKQFTCPTSSAQTSAATFLPFEHGFMLRLDENPLIYVYYNHNKEWEQVADNWREGQPESSAEISPPGPDQYQPMRGFGLVWEANQRRSILGFATAAKPESFQAIVQTFPGGILIGNRETHKTYTFLRSKLRL